jgi:hypothetical protein
MGDAVIVLIIYVSIEFYLMFKMLNLRLIRLLESYNQFDQLYNKLYISYESN